MPRKRTLKELKCDLTESFTIDDYLELRTRFPKHDSPLWMVMANDEYDLSWGFEYGMQHEEDFEQFGIKLTLYLGALDGDCDKIDQLCLRTLEALSNRQKLEATKPHAVASGLAIGDALVDFICVSILECLSHHGLRPPHSYQILLKSRLGLFDSKFLKDRSTIDRRRIVAMFMVQHPELSDREVARSMGVAHTTISRWRSEPRFKRALRIARLVLEDE